MYPWPSRRMQERYSGDRIGEFRRHSRIMLLISLHWLYSSSSSSPGKSSERGEKHTKHLQYFRLKHERSAVQSSSILVPVAIFARADPELRPRELFPKRLMIRTDNCDLTSWVSGVIIVDRWKITYLMQCPAILLFSSASYFDAFNTTAIIPVVGYIIIPFSYFVSITAMLPYLSQLTYLVIFCPRSFWYSNEASPSCSKWISFQDRSPPKDRDENICQDCNPLCSICSHASSFLNDQKGLPKDPPTWLSNHLISSRDDWLDRCRPGSLNKVMICSIKCCMNGQSSWY